jgi:hypothetical protein
MARRGRRCLVEGCWRKARSGKAVCRDHEQSGVGRVIGQEVTKLEREMRTLLEAKDEQERVGAARHFRRKVERGEFATLFSGKFGELVQELGHKEGMQDEIGALRVAVIRLMLEENDPAKMATALSKVVHATAVAMKVQSALFPPPNPLLQEINEAWAWLRRNEERKRLADADQRGREEGRWGESKALPEGPDAEWTGSE